MLRDGATYWLFYSGNDWNGRSVRGRGGALLRARRPVHGGPGEPGARVHAGRGRAGRW